MFISKICKKLPGVKAKILSQYGRDFVNFSRYFDIYPEYPTQDWTLIYENQSKEGLIAKQKAFNREYAKSLPIDEEFTKIVEASDVLFIAPLTASFSTEYIKNVVQLNPKALKILLPQGYYRNFDFGDNVIEREFSEADSLMPLFDFAIIPSWIHKNGDLTKKWSRKTTVVVTLGKEGSMAIKRGRILKVPTKVVDARDIVDSVGSSDIFAASFAFEYFRTKDVKKALWFGNNIARQCLFYPSNELQFVVPQH